MKKATTPEKGYILNLTKKQINKLLIMHILLTKNHGLYGKEIRSLLHEKGFLDEQELPTHGSLYPLLHEMYEEGLLRREEKLLKPDPYEKTYQKVVMYHLTDKGREEYQLMKKKFLGYFQRQERFIKKIYTEIYNQ